MQTTNVCVVGAGPSGATTSLMLSKMGISHVVLDKAVFPRDKTCGDGLVLYVFQVLKEIDPKLLTKFIESPAFLHSYKTNFYASDKICLDIYPSKERKPYAPFFYGKRIDFDNFLVENLPSNYADVRLGVGLKDIERLKNGQGLKLTLEDGNEVITKILVGADGIQSLVRRKLGNNKPDKKHTSTFISAYFEGIKDLSPENIAEIRLIYQNMPLFFYIFPLVDGISNVSFGGNTAKIGLHKINLKTEIENIITTHPQIKEKFTSAHRLGDWRGWGIPSFFGHLRVSGDNFLLVGDAAGLANPFYKEGVGTGMMSGLIAAKKIQEALKKECFDSSFFAEYESLLSQKFGKLLSYSKLSLKIAQSSYFFSFFIGFMKGIIEKVMIRIIEKQSY
ncbi:MAG: NAD(P)/FAD-dependent oxidoreductase [Snowella sp.]|nr:NAD(P)/FAD-dependent oxidoreductase [Snowella sp.]